jgi:3-dehydroquinate dehydratase-1/3-dehydroquinate dehydratase/shikimate dehydrogenase
VGKIVTMAKTSADVLRVLSLLLLAAEKGFPLIAFCMGKVGMISRLATVQLGGYMTYAAPDSGQVTASGQLKVSALRSMLKTLVGEA